MPPAMLRMRCGRRRPRPSAARSPSRRTPFRGCARCRGWISQAAGWKPTGRLEQLIEHVAGEVAPRDMRHFVPDRGRQHVLRRLAEHRFRQDDGPRRRPPGRRSAAEKRSSHAAQPEGLLAAVPHAIEQLRNCRVPRRPRIRTVRMDAHASRARRKRTNRKHAPNRRLAVVRRRRRSGKPAPAPARGAGAARPHRGFRRGGSRPPKRDRIAAPGVDCPCGRWPAAAGSPPSVPPPKPHAGGWRDRGASNRQTSAATAGGQRNLP